MALEMQDLIRRVVPKTLFGLDLAEDAQLPSGARPARSDQCGQALFAFPQRGSYLRELLDLGVREYREVFFKPYRILYHVLEDGVYVMVIADGRRDMRALLQRRLLRV